ncbi:hypothetical protein [Paraburkholderia fungorum]|uniref:hypothetical protein n=1 Tax=Paraburkholderia fungorum TaxID=134537 RepID=UPI003877A965
MAIKFPDPPSFYADVEQWTRYLQLLRELDHDNDRAVKLAIKSAEGMIFQLKHPLEPTSSSKATDEPQKHSRMYL